MKYEDIKMLKVSLGQVLSDIPKVANMGAKNLKYLEGKYKLTSQQLIDISNKETKILTQYTHTRQYPKVIQTTKLSFAL